MTETSKISFATIAVDTPALLSACIARETGAARRVFLAEANCRFVTTVHNMLEAQKHLPWLSAKYGLSLEKASGNLAALPLEIYAEATYASHLEEARSLIGKRDPNDVPLLALALAFQIPIWSNDRDFENLPVQLYPTARLLKFLGL